MTENELCNDILFLRKWHPTVKWHIIVKRHTMKLIKDGTGEEGQIPNTNLIETMTGLNHKCGVERKWQISDLVKRNTLCKSVIYKINTMKIPMGLLIHAQNFANWFHKKLFSFLDTMLKPNVMISFLRKNVTTLV